MILSQEVISQIVSKYFSQRDLRITQLERRLASAEAQIRLLFRQLNPTTKKGDSRDTKDQRAAS